MDPFLKNRFMGDGISSSPLEIPVLSTLIEAAQNEPIASSEATGLIVNVQQLLKRGAL